jgi:uncharacterized OB-fold protein
MRHAAKRNASEEAALMAAQQGAAGTICPACGTMFAPIRSTRRYCSDKCRLRVWRRHQRADLQAKAARPWA